MINVLNIEDNSMKNAGDSGTSSTHIISPGKHYIGLEFDDWKMVVFLFIYSLLFFK